MARDAQLIRETRRFAVEYRPRSWWLLSSTLLLFLGLIAVTVLDLPFFLRLPASILLSLLHVRVFVIYHDYLHGAILKRSPFAAGAFRLYGLLALSPASIWKDTHDHHHRNNSKRCSVDNIGSFPIMTTQAYREAGRGVRFLYALSRHPATIALGYVTVFLYGFCIKPLLMNPRRHWDAGAALLLHLGLVILLSCLRPDVLVLALLLPSFIGSALGAYLFYAQHNFPEAKLRQGLEWDYVFAALRSSSFIRMNPFMRWFTANIGYHHVHHLNSRIPFYRLPEAMAAISRLQSPGVTTLKPRDVFRCLRLKLWDPEKDRLVTFREGRLALLAEPVRPL